MTAVGALFDSSRQLINGPTNAISIAVLSVISIVPSVDEKVQAAVLLAFMVGIVQLVITSMRLGDLTRYISHSVIIGFTLGASALLVLDQMKNLLGLAPMGGVHDPFLYRFWLTMTQDGAVNMATLSIGLASIAMVLALRWLKNRLGLSLLPELLLTVLTMAAVVAWLGLEANGVRVVGEIPAKLPTPRLPTIDYDLIRELSGGALAIAILGLLEAIAMSKAIAAQTRQKLDMNQQCLSEGLANFTGSFFQCMPGSGSLTRSAINQQAGAVSQWSGVVSAAVVALIMVAFAPYARLIPRAALAGILIVSAWKMIDWRGLYYHLRVTRFDAVIVGATALSAVAISIEFCVLIGVVMSSLLTVRRAGRMLLTEFTITPDGAIRERFPDDRRCNRLLIYGLEGEMFFGASAALESHFQRIEQRIDAHTRAVVLRLKRARNADAAGMILLKDFVDRVQARGVHVLLCGVRRDLAHRMETTGLSASIRAPIFREEKVPLTSTILAIRHANQLIGEPCATCPRRGSGEGIPSLRYVI
jgi:SulP family sulfate permease